MRNFLLCIVLSAPALHAEEPPASPVPLSQSEMIDSMSIGEVSQAIEALKKSFLDPSAVTDEALQRATLAGLLLRLAPGVSLSASPVSDPATTIPFLAEILDSHLGYVRLGVLDGAALAQFDTALASFKSKDVDALILDLRGAPASGEFESVAEFARRLVPNGKLLFTIQKPSAKQERIFTSNQDPQFQGTIVVLTGSRTGGAPEALAGTLRANADAMIIGADTEGAAVEFEHVPVGQGRKLDIAISQVLLPDVGPIFPKGIRPDIAISLPADVQEQVFRESTEKGVSQFVFDSERRRINEASLVANTNPEIDGAKDEPETPAPRDTVLQRAVDLVTAIRFYSKKSK